MVSTFLKMKKVSVYFSFVFCLTGLALSAQTNSAAEEAMRNFRYREAAALLDEQPQTRETRLLKADCYQKLSDFASAIAIYENLLKEDRDDLQTVIAIAECADRIGDAEKSVHYWEEANRISPDNQFLLTQKALAYYRADDWKETISAAEKVFQTDSIPVLLRMAGDAYVGLGNQKGLSLYQAALRKNPSDYISVSRLANFYYSAKLYDDAIAITDTFLTRVNPRHKSIGRLNGMANYAAKNYDKAIERLNINVDAGDSTYTTCFTLGMSYYASDRYLDAVKWLEKAYEKDNSDVNLLYYYGTVLFQAFNPDKALGVLSQGVKKIEEMDALMFNFDLSLANAHLILSQYDEAVGYFKDGYARRPDQPALLYNIAHAYDSAKKTKSAVDYYERFLNTKPKDVIVDDSPVDADKLDDVPIRILYYKMAYARMKELKAWLKSSSASGK